MTVAESKGLKKGARVYWQGDAADSGVITETTAVHVSSSRKRAAISTSAEGTSPRTRSTFSCDIAYPRSPARRSAAARASPMSVWVVNRTRRPSADQQMAHPSR